MRQCPGYLTKAEALVQRPRARVALEYLERNGLPVSLRLRQKPAHDVRSNAQTLERRRDLDASSSS